MAAAIIESRMERTMVVDGRETNETFRYEYLIVRVERAWDNVNLSAQS